MPLAEFEQTEYGGQVLGDELHQQIAELATSVTDIRTEQSLVVLRSELQPADETSRWASEVSFSTEPYDWVERYLALIRVPALVTTAVDWIATSPPRPIRES